MRGRSQSPGSSAWAPEHTPADKRAQHDETLVLNYRLNATHTHEVSEEKDGSATWGRAGWGGHKIEAGC